MRDGTWYFVIAATVLAGLLCAILVEEATRAAGGPLPQLVLAIAALVLAAAVLVCLGSFVWAFFAFFGAVKDLAKPPR